MISTFRVRFSCSLANPNKSQAPNNFPFDWRREAWAGTAQLQSASHRRDRIPDPGTIIAPPTHAMSMIGLHIFTVTLAYAHSRLYWHTPIQDLDTHNQALQVWTHGHSHPSLVYQGYALKHKAPKQELQLSSEVHRNGVVRVLHDMTTHA